MVNLLHVGRGSASGIPLSIAEKHGFFEKHGIEVEVVLVHGTQVPQLTGLTPLGFIGAPAALLRATDGADIRIVASFNTARIFSHLIVRSDIRKVENLPGKRFGVRALGAGAWIETIVALEHLGLEPKRDEISVLPIGDAAAIAQGLEDGTIDAAVLAPAQTRALQARGYSVLCELYPADLYGFSYAIAVTASFLQDSAEVVDKLLLALTDSMAFSLAPKNKPTVLMNIMDTFGITDPNAAEDGYQELIRSARPKPYPDVVQLRNMQRIMALHNPNVLNVALEALVDQRRVRELDASGSIDRLFGSHAVVEP